MGMLDGKVAIVTGAGRGIGRGHAIELARQGAKVVVNDLGGAWDGTGSDDTPAGQVVQEIKALGGEAVANFDNVAEFSGAERLVNQAVESFGALDILINNAGILRDRMAFNMREDDWDAVVDVHGKGHFAPTHFACAHWRNLSKEVGGPVYGRIVHTTSESGLFSTAGQANYAFAKTGIASFSAVIAKEMSRYGVTSNAIAPRARTRLTEMTFGQFGGQPGQSTFDAMSPDNIAPFVVYLCTPEAGHISGQVFLVFGGTVTFVEQYKLANSITKTDRWTVEELAERTNELLGDRPTAPPQQQRAPGRAGGR